MSSPHQSKKDLPSERNVAGKMVSVILDAHDSNKKPELIKSIAILYGFDYHKPPLIYPYDKYMQIAEYLGKMLYPELDSQAALEEIGYKSVMHYFHSPLGQVLKVLAGVLGPYNGAKVFVQNLSQRLPWGIHEIEEIRPHYVRLRIRGVPGKGGLTRGSLQAAVEVAGGKIKKLTTTILDTEDLVFEIELE